MTQLCKFNSMNKGLIFGLLGIVALIFLSAFFLKDEEDVLVEPEIIVEPAVEEVVLPVVNEVIGQSVEARDIEVYRFGTGETNLLFVGGIHGGYEANTVDLANAMIEHFGNNLSEIPEHITMHIIPNLNPDGYARLLATDQTYSDAQRRFNANGVDLNRNFACKWQPESTWRGNVVSAGTAAFSEPEAAALRDYVNLHTPKAAVFWHSKANNVYASECENGVLPETITLMNTYALAGDYGAVEKFDAYEVTGDAEGWLATLNIPAVTVELETRNDMEWNRNLRGVMAVLELY